MCYYAFSPRLLPSHASPHGFDPRAQNICRPQDKPETCIHRASNPWRELRTISSSSLMKKLEAFSLFGLIVLATLHVAHNFLRFTNEETSFFTVHRRRCGAERGKVEPYRLRLFLPSGSPPNPPHSQHPNTCMSE